MTTPTYCPTCGARDDATDRGLGIDVPALIAERDALRAALDMIAQTAVMFETWAPECFPEVNAQGQKHFARVMMESGAESIRNAIRKIEAKP